MACVLQTCRQFRALRSQSGTVGKALMAEGPMSSNGTDRQSILVVDDNEEIRDLLVLVLEEEGYAVSAVASGDEALGVARAQRPDLITLDLSMPGTDGWAVLRELQSDSQTMC